MLCSLEIFHSSTIGSPSIRSNSWYSGVVVNRPIFAVHASMAAVGYRVRDDVDHSLSTVGPVCRSAELPDRMGLSTNESPISRCVWWLRRCLCCPLVASVRPLLALDGPPQPPLLSWPALVVVGVTVIRARQLTQHCNTAEELVRRWICQRHRGCNYTDCNCSDTMIARYVDRVISRMSLKSVRRDSRQQLVSLPNSSLTVTRAARRQACTSGLSVTVAAVSVDRVLGGVLGGSQYVTGLRVR